ncbi:hypothetical protein LTR10_008864 [Elasticomyces elasticus]|nr:hypothetical protein LTR10_008864 [Elasticomyces elasticus]KAK4974165.1 hypothetical protein LTR42_004804 [Elasticomyces elasticus]
MPEVDLRFYKAIGTMHEDDVSPLGQASRFYSGLLPNLYSTTLYSLGPSPSSRTVLLKLDRTRHYNEVRPNSTVPTKAALFFDWDETNKAMKEMLKELREMFPGAVKSAVAALDREGEVSSPGYHREIARVKDEMAEQRDRVSNAVFAVGQAIYHQRLLRLKDGNDSRSEASSGRFL